MDIFTEILAALEKEDRVVLATIVSTSGSTPAGASSRMLIRQGGAVTSGTIGGGCMEGDVILHAHRIIQSGKPEILTFHLTEDDTEAGLICGGSLEVLLEPLTRSECTVIGRLRDTLSRGDDCVLVTFLPPAGDFSRKEIMLTVDPPERLAAAFNLSAAAQVAGLLRAVRTRNETRHVRLPEGDLVVEPLTAAPPMLIFGGGHVSRALSAMAAMAGFRVTIVDDREKYSNPARFPEADRTIIADFDHAFDTLAVLPSAFVVIVTRGHRYDERVLEQALTTPARYIGLIGSRRKVLTSFEHLRANGISDEQLARVSGPVGLDIGAATAEEIAVSILAECIHARRSPGRPLRHMSEKPGSPA